MKKISDYNKERGFAIDFRESRLKKVAKIIRRLPPGKLLDIGCAQGEWASYWLTKGWECFGIDVNPLAVESAQQKGIRAQVGDLSQGALSYADDFFDLIFAGEVIEHMIDTDGFLNEIHRCLKPAGHIILTTPNLASWENRFRLFFGKYPRWLDYRLEGCGHVRGYTPTVLTRQLKEKGFSIIRQQGNWIPFLPQSIVDDIKWPILSMTGNLFPNLAMDIIIWGQKK